eukprot:762624-Hanusia_phi.AAC.3
MLVSVYLLPLLPHRVAHVHRAERIDERIDLVGPRLDLDRGGRLVHRVISGDRMRALRSDPPLPLDLSSHVSFFPPSLSKPPRGPRSDAPRQRDERRWSSCGPAAARVRRNAASASESKAYAPSSLPCGSELARAVLEQPAHDAPRRGGHRPVRGPSGGGRPRHSCHDNGLTR